MDELETVDKWYSKFSDRLEDAFPDMEGYTAHNNILWLIQEVKTLRLDNTYLQQRLKRGYTTFRVINK